MVVSRTFSDSHYVSFPGSRLKVRQRLRDEAMNFIEAHLSEGQLVSVSETADEYVSSVTVWYRAGRPERML